MRNTLALKIYLLWICAVFLSFPPVASARYFHKAPSSDIIRLAEKASFSHTGREIFYKTEPVLLPRAEFSAACNRHEGVSSLGCFDGENIKLFEIKEAKLEGMIAATAAHEMLHAAYDDLRKAERKRIDGLVKEVVAMVTDKDILAKFDEYRKRDTDVLPSEYHSIVGTEVENLPGSLELHYSRYFNNRKALVALTRSYYDELNARKKTIEVTDNELDKMRQDIELRMKILKTKQSHLDALKKRLESHETSPTRENDETYNKLAEEFNKDAGHLKTKTDEFNRIAKERNKKAIESQKLYESLDSQI